MVGSEGNGSVCFSRISMFSEADSHCNYVVVFFLAEDFQVALNHSRLKEAIVSKEFVLSASASASASSSCFPHHKYNNNKTF